MEKFYSCKIKINKEQNLKRLDQALAKLSNYTRSQIKILLNNNNIKKVLIYPKKSKAMNLAFDVPPAKYVTGLITEKGVCEASKEGLKKLFK